MRSAIWIGAVAGTVRKLLIGDFITFLEKGVLTAQSGMDDACRQFMTRTRKVLGATCFVPSDRFEVAAAITIVAKNK